VEGFAGILTITYDFSDARSLKDKRRVLKSLLDKVRRVRHVSVSEVGFQNRIRSSVVIAAIVGPNKRTVDRERAAVESMLCESHEAEAVEVVWEWL
jgi:uncharacterized protein YlxP (DUF503 family)